MELLVTWFSCVSQINLEFTTTLVTCSHARARCSSDEGVGDFFEKLGGIYARLNLLLKPMQIYNLDETCINIVHKPGKVVMEIGRRKVWPITSGERGRTQSFNL